VIDKSFSDKAAAASSRNAAAALLWNRSGLDRKFSSRSGTGGANGKVTQPGVAWCFTIICGTIETPIEAATIGQLSCAQAAGAPSSRSPEQAVDPAVAERDREGLGVRDGGDVAGALGDLQPQPGRVFMPIGEPRFPLATGGERDDRQILLDRHETPSPLPPSNSSSIISDSLTSAITAPTASLPRILSIEASRSAWLRHSSVTQITSGRPAWRLTR